MIVDTFSFGFMNLIVDIWLILLLLISIKWTIKLNIFKKRLIKLIQ